MSCLSNEKNDEVKITTILFDLDGTVLPMDNDEFTKGYFAMLAAKFAKLGYEKEKLIASVWAGSSGGDD